MKLESVERMEARYTVVMIQEMNRQVIALSKMRKPHTLWSRALRLTRQARYAFAIRARSVVCVMLVRSCSVPVTKRNAVIAAHLAGLLNVVRKI